MLAVQSVVPELVVACLNNQANPFYLDGFGKSANDYAQHLQDVKGVNFVNLITQAENAWKDQLSAEEIEEYKQPIANSHLF